jgi:NAD(P)-dependent dehydrogenase (short-subunit alcohol dehydrogenase family)
MMHTTRPKGNVRYDHSGRVVIVTGGVNGIGRAICHGFASAGACVICADVDESSAIPLPNGCVFKKLDVSIESECERVIGETDREFGGLDILVNNAAVQPPSSYKRVDEIDDDEYQRMLAVNLSGYLYMAKHALRIMRRQQMGVVVNIASGQGHRTARGVPVYGPIKAANLMQTMQWGIEYARDGIRVVSVSPGAIDTPMVRASLEAQGGESELANRHPMGRIGLPYEVAHAVLWLASNAASFITATDLSVDGGLKAFGAFADPYERIDETNRD